MELSGAMLVIVVLACFVFLILKMRNKSDTLPVTVVPEPGKSPPEAEPKQKEPEKTEIIIYQYKPVKSKRLCHVCDGENEPYARECCICGQTLR